MKIKCMMYINFQVNHQHGKSSPDLPFTSTIVPFRSYGHPQQPQTPVASHLLSFYSTVPPMLTPLCYVLYAPHLIDFMFQIKKQVQCFPVNKKNCRVYACICLAVHLSPCTMAHIPSLHPTVSTVNTYGHNKMAIVCNQAVLEKALIFFHCLQLGANRMAMNKVKLLTDGLVIK